MADKLEFDADGAIAHVEREAMGAIHRAAITVTRRAKELLSVSGTAVATGVTHAMHAAAKARTAKAAHKAAHAAMFRENRAFAKRFNAQFKHQIGMGELKKLRVAKAGHLTDRAKPGSKKTYYFNVGGKMVRRRRRPKGP